MPGGDEVAAGDGALRAPEREPDRSSRLKRGLHFWRSPPGQPAWARPALLAIAALAGLAYAWNIESTYLEPFYGGAARSMALSWHNFFFGAADPWGSVSVDKLPGALWLQALSIRAFGPHVWAFALPQVLEGVLTIFVLYDAVRRVAGAGAGIVAAVVMTTSPIVILLDHGNISDTLLILLLVAAADATIRAVVGGRAGPLLWAGLFVGLAFQAKMLQAWLVLPALFLTYLLASPVRSLWRRSVHVVVSGLIALAVSLSYMSAVSLVPSGSRPYVDGSCDDSIFNQVFSYNGLNRVGNTLLDSHGCSRPSRWIENLSRTASRLHLNTGAIAPGWDRLLHGVFGHDDAWLLLAAVVAAVGLFVASRDKPRTDPLRAATVLWLTWLVVTFAAFSAGRPVNSYYVAALVPAVAALCGMGGAAAWHRRRIRSVRVTLLVLVIATVAIDVALVPGYVGVRDWVVAASVVVGVLASAVLLASLLPRHDSVWSLAAGPALAAAALLLGTGWASAIVVTEGLGPFDSPYAPASVNRATQAAIADYGPDQQALLRFVATVPRGQAADVLETSRAAGDYILATGREFLPVGGFSGVVPAPTLDQFEHDIDAGRVRQVTLATAPLSANPIMRWVYGHCRDSGRGFTNADARTHFAVYVCRPAATPARRRA
jgi:4-amino-4-deoxy-L-arabinose transferase-like glycosyltransferase